MIGTDHEGDAPVPGATAGAPTPPRGPSNGAHVPDDPILSALRGDHPHLAVNGLAARYRTDVAPLPALADRSDPRAWADLLRTPDGPAGHAST